MELTHATPDAHFATLDQTIVDRGDYELALRHAPLIKFDHAEPFLPSVAGYTVFRQTSPSLSFPRDVTLPAGAALAIEYAIWWDWDIQHLYELEHIWVYLDAAEKIIAADASWHGGYHAMLDAAGSVPVLDGRVLLFSEPGKHAFAPVVDWLIERQPITLASCDKRSGVGGVLVTPLFEGIIQDRTPLNNNLVHAWLEKQAFAPTYEFGRVFDLAQAVFVIWHTLKEWIPTRVTWWTQYLLHHTAENGYRPLRIAHRGASAYAQEGSQALIEKAAELGSDMVEVDIRITADDVPVIAHDASLQRVFGVPGNIADMTLAEIGAATPSHCQPILTFAQMLTLCTSLGMGLYLDIKEVSPNAVQQIFQSLQAENALKQVIFASFRPDVVAEIKATAPDVLTSILFSSAHVDPVALAAAVQANFVHPCWERFDAPSALLTEDWLERVRAAKLGIICWHEERPQEIVRLNQLGVDGICSDQPELLKIALRL